METQRLIPLNCRLPQAVKMLAGPKGGEFFAGFQSFLFDNSIERGR